MKCNICGFENPDGASFCRTCGSSLQKKDGSAENIPSQAQQPNFSNNNAESNIPNENTDNADIAYPWGEYPSEQVSNSDMQNNNQQSAPIPAQAPTPAPIPARPVSPSMDPAHMSSTKEKKSSKGMTALIIILVVALLASIGVVTYLLLSKDDDENSSTSNNYSQKKSDKDDEDAESEDDPSDEEDDIAIDSAADSAVESDISSDAEADDDKPDIIIDPDADPVPGSKPNPGQVHYYEAIKADITWTEAKYIAESMGGYLVCINDYNEYDEICNLAMSNGITCCWVGAQLGSNYSWDYVRWLDGTYVPTSRSVWHDNEPSYKDEKLNIYENYLMLSYWSDTAGWGLNDSPNDAADILGSGKVGYIVEYGYN